MEDNNLIEITGIKPTVEIGPHVSMGMNGSDPNAEVLGVLRKAICALQGDVIQHIYWGAELHKRLRTATDPAEIRKMIDAIEGDLPAIFQQSWRVTVEHLRNYFRLTHNSTYLPRMCIKDTIERGGKKHMIDIFREDGGRTMIEYPITNNTGFDSVEKDGRYFICNNIPEAIKNNSYINPRLDQRAARKYHPPSKLKKLLPWQFQKLDREWAECWTDFSHEKDNSSSCYKSTIIVPMTLINCYLDNDFIRDTCVGKSKRTIYGFLCFDHPQENYFHGDDINVGYIFADLLSFYQISQHSITTYSETFKQKKRN